MANSYDVVGRAYRADIYCDEHAEEAVRRDYPQAHGWNLEELGESIGIDVECEETYDSANLSQSNF